MRCLTIRWVHFLFKQYVACICKDFYQPNKEKLLKFKSLIKHCHLDVFQIREISSYWISEDHENNFG